MIPVLLMEGGVAFGAGALGAVVGGGFLVSFG